MLSIFKSIFKNPDDELDEHIKQLSKSISQHEKKLARLSSDKTVLSEHLVFYQELQTMREVFKKRKTALEKIKRGHPITSEEHALLKKVKALNELALVCNYPNISNIKEAEIDKTRLSPESHKEFNNHIKLLENNLDELDKLAHNADPYIPPESLIPYNGGFISMSSLWAKAEAHQSRITALKKMKEGDFITSKEHELLKKVKELSESTLVCDYPRIWYTNTEEIKSDKTHSFTNLLKKLV